jgi:hypothetical protein
MPFDPVSLGIMGGMQLASSIGSGLIGSNAASSASAAQARALEEALNYSKQIYGETKENLAPWITQGSDALGRASETVAGMQQPGFNPQYKPFEFNGYDDPNASAIMQQAAKAINASSLARGASGGGAISAIGTQVANEANKAYAPQWQRWFDDTQMRNQQEQQKYQRGTDWMGQKIKANTDLAGMGEGAAQTLGGFGSSQGQFGAGLIGNKGSANAAGTMGAANSWTNSLGSLGQGMSTAYGFSNDQFDPSFGMNDRIKVVNNETADMLKGW